MIYRPLRAGLTGLLALTAIAHAQPADGPIPIGRASNLNGVLRHEANPVTACETTGAVVFVHPQDVTIWGGGANANGRLRYDVSVDRGVAFTTDVGMLQQVYRAYARQPSAALRCPPDLREPLTDHLTWVAGTDRFPVPGWVGHVAGTAELTVGQPRSSEHELFEADAQRPPVPGSLVQGTAETFWTIGAQAEGADDRGVVTVYRGDFDVARGDVIWAQAHRFQPRMRARPEGAVGPLARSPQIGFAPDGQVGWITLLGSLDVGPEAPPGGVLTLRSDDGGRRFTDPAMVPLEETPLIRADGSMMQLGEALRAAGGRGAPMPTGQSDLTVDVEGNPHLLLGLADTARDGFSPAVDGLHLLVDLTSRDGGRSWTLLEIAALNTHTAPVGRAGSPTYGNEPHIARDARGERVFFTWVDTESANAAPGSVVNGAPDLFVAALRVRDQRWAPPRNVSADLPQLGQHIFFPHLAPTALRRGEGWSLAVVTADLIIGDAEAPVAFHYLGNVATVAEAEFEEVVEPMPDAGVAADAGVVEDAAVEDASTPDRPDLATEPSDAEPADAARADQGEADAERDEGADPTVDASAAVDAATPGAEPSGADDDEGGCACRASERGEAPGPAWLLLALLAIRPRRRAGLDVGRPRP